MSGRVSFTPTAPVRRALERLVEGGLHGRTPGEVAERLVCHRIEKLIGSAVLPVERISVRRPKR